MMRSMRRIATPVFWVVAITFIGWLAYGQVTQILGGGKDVVLRVNGREVHVAEYEAGLQAAYDRFRHETGRPMTRDDEQAVQQDVIDQLTGEILLEQQYDRLGLTVTDQEVIQAARTTPPPEVAQDAQFQTNGQFDIAKWQRFLATASDPQFLQSMELRYRQQIPQAKLAEYLTADLFLSDGKLWRIYRDTHESVTVNVLALRPEQIPDQQVPVSDAELEQYYTAHKPDFKRSALAYLSCVAQPRQPDAKDSSLALARVRRLRAEILGGAKFETVAKRESADTATGSKGGDLGWVRRSQPGFDPRFLAGLRGLPTGPISQPVLTSAGYHLIRIIASAAFGDSLHVEHILIPIELQGAHLDYVEGRADSLDKGAAERPDPGALDSVAKRLGLPVTRGVTLIEGNRLTLGPYSIPDVSIWAFEAKVGETSPLIEAEPAYYVFRLDSLEPAGTPPLGVVQDEVRRLVRLAKKRDLVARHAAELARVLAGAKDLASVAKTMGQPLERAGPFTRVTPPPLLQGNPYIVGVAFGLAPGTRSGVLEGQTGTFVLECVGRTRADSTAWLTQKDTERESLLQPVRQARVEAFLAAIRARAKVVDRRKLVFKQQAAAS